MESFVKKMCEYIINNLDNEINLDDMEDEFHYNKFYLTKLFKEYTGFTIMEFANECRVYNSTDDLMFTDDTILKVALENGFNSQEYYSEKFKDIIGLSPLRFRKLYLLSCLSQDEDFEFFDEIIDYKEYLKKPDNYVESPKVLKKCA